MKFFDKVNNIFNKYLLFFVGGVAALALLLPQSFAWASDHTSVFLQVIMFSMGMTMTVKDFSEVFKAPGKVLLVTTMQFGWMPLSAFLIARFFNLPADIALGLILVGCVPGGTSSNVVTYLANGNVPLSVTATSISTLLAPLLTPLFLTFYGGSYVEIAFWPMFLSIFQVVLLPILGGLALNHFLNKYVASIKAFLPTVSALGVLLVLGGTVSVNATTLLTSGAIIFLVVTLHNLSGYAFAGLVCKLLKIDTPSSRAMSVEVAMQNTGLAASLGLTHFNPATALAGATGAILHTLIGVLYATFMKKKDAMAEEKAQNSKVFNLAPKRTYAQKQV